MIFLILAGITLLILGAVLVARSIDKAVEDWGPPPE